MIILPERDIPKGRFLLPQRKRVWDQPSQRRDHKSIPDQTRFRLTARLNDGAIAWKGWFDDREDADEFLWAMATGRLPYERELWRLPTPWWGPDLGERLSYEFDTVTFLTSGAVYDGSTQNWNVPPDWSSTNSVECIGGAGAGFTPISGVASGSEGGGGGAYAKKSGVVLTPGGTTIYSIGAGGWNQSGAGVSGAQTWFQDPATTVLAAAGRGGGNGDIGGAVADCVGDVKFAGGNGAYISSYGGAGGGGGGGPNGKGGDSAIIGMTGYPNSGGVGGGGNGGGESSANHGGSSTSTPGGNNFRGTGAGAGTPNGNGGAGTLGGGGGGASGLWNYTAGIGGNGDDWDATHGSGGGGGGAGTYGTTDGGWGNYGGLYGGGGGGGGYGSSTSGSGYPGGQGIVVVTYTPQLASKAGFNMPMMGM